MAINKDQFKKDLLVLLRKYGILKEKGSTELHIKTNGAGILSVRINNIENI